MYGTSMQPTCLRYLRWLSIFAPAHYKLPHLPGLILTIARKSTLAEVHFVCEWSFVALKLSAVQGQKAHASRQRFRQNSNHSLGRSAISVWSESFSARLVQLLCFCCVSASGSVAFDCLQCNPFVLLQFLRSKSHRQAILRARSTGSTRLTREANIVPLSGLLDSLFHLNNMEPQELHASTTLPTTPVTKAMSTSMTATTEMQIQRQTDTLRETPTTQEKSATALAITCCMAVWVKPRAIDCNRTFMLPSYYFSVCTSSQGTSFRSWRHRSASCHHASHAQKTKHCQMPT